MTSTLVVVQQLRRRVPGGVGTYARGLLQGLGAVASAQGTGARGGDAAVTLLASGPLRRGTEPAGTLRSGWHVPQRRIPLPGPLVTRAWDLGLLGAPSGYDVVHATSFAYPRRGLPAMTVMVHDLAWRRYPETTTRRGRRWHEHGLRHVLGAADKIVVPSPAVGELVQGAGALRASVVVIPHGCDHLAPPDDAAADRMLSDAGVRGPYVLSVGTLEPRKNLGRLVEAYGLAVHEMDEPVPLVVVGPDGWGGASTAVRATSAEPGPARSVVPVGAVSPGVLSALYRRARLLVYVPIDEGFGLPPLEAALVGTPVVASGAVPSMDGGAEPVCEQVDPCDTDDIARGILRVLSDGEHACRIAGSGQAKARSMTWEASARAHLTLWATVAESSQ